MPRTASSYGPVLDLVPTAAALDNRAQGTAFMRDVGGNVYGFAGDMRKLYRFFLHALTDVSKAGGYTTGDQERWSFATFGQTMIATNFADPIQQYTIGSSSLFSDLSPDAPRARYAARVRDFIMVANTFDAIDGARPQRVWFPAIGDPTTWPTPGTILAAQLQSDFQELSGEGNWNQGIVGGLSAADAAIFQERNIWRAQYVGPPAVFSFQVVESARGTPAPGSICSIGPAAFYLAHDGFYMFDGLQSVPIGQGKVDQYFWDNVDQNYLYRVSAAADPQNKLIYVAFPSLANSGGTPDTILCYHYGYQRWSNVTMTIELLAQSMTIGYTLEDLDAFGTLDTLPYSLDSLFWVGGKNNLAAFSSTHRLSTFTGATLQARIESTEVQLNKVGSAHVSRIWPIIDVSTATARLGYRDKISDIVSWTNAASLTTTTGSAPLLATARYHRASITVPAGATWTHAQGINFEDRPAGRR